MDQGKYIWCRNCREIHHVTPFDRSPLFILEAGEEKVFSMNDWRHFMQRHDGHKLEALQAFGMSYNPGIPPFDPMKERYVEVTNGQENFVIRSFRNSIEEPLNFELLHGRLKTTRVVVEIQQNEIRKEMQYHFPWEPSAPLEDKKIDLFISLFSEFVKDLDVSSIEVQGYSRTGSSLLFGLLDNRIVDNIMEMCATYFSPAELKGIRRFCEHHMTSDGVMGLMIRHEFGIEKSA